MTYVCRDRTAAAVVCSGAALENHPSISPFGMIETLPPVIVASFSSVFSKKAIISTELVTLLSTLREYGVTFATMNRAATETVATALLDLDSLRIAKWHHRRSNPVFVRGSAIQTPRLDCSLPTCMLAVATDRMKMAYKLNAKTGELPATSTLEVGGMVAACTRKCFGTLGVNQPNCCSCFVSDCKCFSFTNGAVHACLAGCSCPCRSSYARTFWTAHAVSCVRRVASRLQRVRALSVD